MAGKGDTRRAHNPCNGARAAATGAALALFCWSSAGSVQAAEPVFTIGNYPVQARAENAVEAKQRAIAEGQQAAFRSLLKRLVPVTAYKSLAQVAKTNASSMIESFAIRSERNSSTDYIASYDFVFAPEAIRKLLDEQAIPYLDRQAPTITIVPAYRVPKELKGKLPPTFSDAAGSDAWLYAWKALDLGNSLTPVALQPKKPEIHDDTLRALGAGDLGYLRTLQSEYLTQSVLVAVLEPEPELKKIKVVLVGRDAVQNMYLKRSYRLEGMDLAYTAELAAVISLAILEGRWKAINVRGAAHAASGAGDSATSGWVSQPVPAAGGSGSWGAPAAAMVGGPVTIAIQFSGMGEWQMISQQLSQTPGVSGFEVLGLSPRGARVSVRYPEGIERLASALAQQGLDLRDAGGTWVLTRR